VGKSAKNQAKNQLVTIDKKYSQGKDEKISQRGAIKHHDFAHMTNAAKIQEFLSPAALSLTDQELRHIFVPLLRV
jgi:hypothetical protein